MKKKELQKVKSRYENVYEILNRLSYLFGNKINNMDLNTMNKWLYRIIKFYELYGIKISINDFKIPNNKRASSIVNRYMNLFFKNINNLDSDEFSKLIFNMEELEFSDNFVNPILDSMYLAVKNIHDNNQKIVDRVFDSVNGVLNSLGIEKVNRNNINLIKEQVRKKKDYYDSEIAKINVLEKNNKLKDDMHTQLCMMVTNGNYQRMSEEDRKRVDSRLLRICLIIVKLRVFSYVKDEYNQYSIDNNYKQLLDVVKGKKIMIEEIERKINAINGKVFTLLKEKRILRLNGQQLRLATEVEEIISNYLNSFYEQYDMSRLTSTYNITGMYDSSKLFGEFDFEKLPPDASKFNIEPEFLDCGINIPSVDSPDFSELSILALKYINNDVNLFDDKKSVARTKKI